MDFFQPPKEEGREKVSKWARLRKNVGREEDKVGEVQ